MEFTLDLLYPLASGVRFVWFLGMQLMFNKVRVLKIMKIAK